MSSNIFTVDVEDWCDRTAFKDYYRESKNSDSNVLEGVENILDICSSTETKATFFLLGKTIEKYPEIVKQINENGHECSSHGYSHEEITNMSPQQFCEELEKTKSLIYSGTKKYPKGFRAPRFSLNKKSSWFLRILHDKSYSYDSSLYPAKAFDYGNSKNLTRPYNISLTNYQEEDLESNLLEYPIAILPLLGKKFPLKYRFLGSTITNLSIKKYNDKGQPAVIYTHPWEHSSKVKMNGLKFKDSLRNINIPCNKTLKKILAKNMFTSFEISMEEKNE